LGTRHGAPAVTDTPTPRKAGPGRPKGSKDSKPRVRLADRKPEGTHLGNGSRRLTLDQPPRKRGTGQRAPGAGRPRLAHIEWCKAQLHDPEVRDTIARVLRDPTLGCFATIWKAVEERAAGKVPQSVALTGEGGGPITVRFVNE
jgi:hypothetical protein